jgi:hypothetical protein
VIDVFYAAPALLILALGVYTTFVRDTFPATVGYIAYGLLLTIAWVQLHGVDVADESAIGGRRASAGSASARLRAAPRPARVPRPLLPAAAPVERRRAAARARGPTLRLEPHRRTRARPSRTGWTGVGNPIAAVLMAYHARGHDARRSRCYRSG